MLLEELLGDDARVLVAHVDGGVQPPQRRRRQQRADSVDRLGERRALGGEDPAATTGTMLPQPNTWRGIAQQRVVAAS